MKQISLLKKSFLCICSAFLFSTLFSSSVSANSAQADWTGTTATGAIVTDDTCPIIVKKEILTFDIQEFPQQHYQNAQDYLAYSGKVTAEYIFFNPAEYTINAVLLFPFGTIPDYGYLRNTDTGELLLGSDTEKYNVTINGTPVEKTLRHTLSLFGSQFEFNKDMALLHDTYMMDDFYSPDMPVTQYTYVPRNVDTKAYDAATAAFTLSTDPSKTKVLLENQSGGKVLDDGVQLDCWVTDGPFVVNVIGESLTQMPDWKFYENGACEKEIDGTMELTNTKIITLKDFVLSEYNEESGVLEQDWYNAMVEAMKYFEWSHGAINVSEFLFDFSDQFMRWYEYAITLGPGETVVNTVTAPIYPSFHTNYEPPIYEYLYLLSPAQSWKQFGALDIIVNTPYHMTEDSIGKFRTTENGYRCHLETLPNSELSFTLCSESNPIAPVSNSHFSSSWIFILAFCFIMAVVILLARKKRTP